MKIAILTISDTRTAETDLSGQKIAELLVQPCEKIIVKDDIGQIRTAYERLRANVLITNGGTGIAKRDVTYEALQPYIRQELPGFGELFRQLSYQEIGSHALASRAFAFFDLNDRLIFALPGSTKACELALKTLIIPEMEHLINERTK